MSKKNVSNIIILDDYKNGQNEEYTNIAEQNEENFKTKKFEKYKPKNSSISVTNILKGEENKLKTMLFSFLKSEEKQTIKRVKSPNNKKRRLSKTIIISSIRDENHIQKFINKNYKQFKKNTKKIKLKSPRKLKKTKSKQQLFYSNLISQKSFSNFYITQDIKRSFSSENPILKKKSQNLNSNIYKNKKLKINLSLFNKNGRDYISENNQGSSKDLSLSPKNTIRKLSDKLPIYLNEKEDKNYLDVNKLKISEINNVCTFHCKNNEEKSNNYARSFSLRNIKNFMKDNFNTLPRKKNRNSVSVSPKNITNLKSTKINFFKYSKNINQLKINKLKIFKINKEKLKQSIIIRPDDQNIESKHFSSRVLNRKDRPKITESIILPPQKLSSSRESIKNFQKTLLINNKNEELIKKETKIDKSTKILTIINGKFRKLIHKGYVYDSLDDEESELDEMAYYFYIDPNSKFCFTFDLILFCLTIYNSIAIPYFLAKNIRVCKGLYFSVFHLFNFISEIFNVIDIILGFFRAYCNYDEKLIVKNKLMIIHYLKSWFLLDLIVSIPFYTIFNSYESSCNDLINNNYYKHELHNLHYLFICIKMIKLLKVFKNNRGYKRICRILKHHLMFQNKGTLIAKIYTILLIIHFGACIHIFIGRNSYPNWISYTKMETKGFLELYLTAIYCLTMTITSVGYGDITCYSFNERIFQIILLIFGIMAYSWIVSSISSYIEKNNNDLNEFRNKIAILKDIKLYHPNMTNKLYSKIMQHLKYKNRNEKNNKNIIFDCLPLSLKNNLIYEMYKSIITKFIFFKNIDNIDFIVKVILSFRPVIAVKNDILFDGGDIVEEIVFVKKGVLTVQLLINTENYKENVKMYSSMNLFNLKNKSNLNKTLKIPYETLYNNNAIIEKLSNQEIINKLNSNSLNETFYKYKIECEDNNRKYIKIINIRENEHFGDVLMFSEQRSPMRVMVRSTKAELFILKKEDVVKISFAYDNIWRRINEKSVYNFEQMKKSIRKIVEVLSPKTLKTSIFAKKKQNNKESKIFNENKTIDSKSSDFNFTESLENSEVDKEEEIKNKEIKNTESLKDQNKTENSLIQSTKYSNINNDNLIFHSASNLKSKNDIQIFKKSKKQISNNPNNKKQGNSAKLIANKKCFRLQLTNNSIQNNYPIVSRNVSSMTTPYRKEEVNQEIYANEKLELTNVDEKSDHLLSKREFSEDFFKNKIIINSKSSIINNFVIDKLNNINIISNVNNVNNYKNNIISKENQFSIGSCYVNFNFLSKNVLINDENLQKKMKMYLRKQTQNQRLSNDVIKIKNLNLFFNKINNGNLVNNSNKKNNLSPTNNRSSIKSLNNISYDSKHNNNISINGIPLNKFNSLKKDNNKNILNKPHESTFKRVKSRTSSITSHDKGGLRRKLSVNYSFNPLNKSGRNSINKINKSIERVRSKSIKSNDLLSLINNNITSSKKNLIEPDKFYRHYFNALINSNSPNNNQNNNKEETRRHMSSKNFPNFEGEYKNFTPKIKLKRQKTCYNKKINS